MHRFTALIVSAAIFLSANSFAQTTSRATAGANGYAIDTFAGSDFTGDNATAGLGILRQSEGIVFDFTGNLYIADAADHRVRMVTRAGIITTVAGNGMPGFSGDGGPASSAQLNSPYGLAFDGAGGLYIADLGNARVRRIALDGTISTVAGGGTLTPGGDNEGSPAAMIALGAPRNVAFDNQGSLYISDFTGQRIFRVDAGGSLTTFAGTGTAGFTNGPGPPNRAEFSFPAGLACDRNGAVYVADSGNHVVRKIANGRVTTLPSLGTTANTPVGMTFDSFGTLYVADLAASQLVIFPVTGAVTTVPIAAFDVTFGIDGYLYASQGATVARISFANLTATVVAGGGSLASGDGGPANNALLHHPAGVAADALGNIYIADRDNNCIRRVGLDGTITTTVGGTLKSPTSVALDSTGNVYIADSGNRRVLKLGVDGKAQVLPFSGLIAPVYVQVDAASNVYVADIGLGAIARVNLLGMNSTMIAHLASPAGFVVDAVGNLYFTEPAAARVRKMDVFGNLTNIAPGAWVNPRAILLGSANDFYVADSGLQRIMHVDSSGAVTTVAGTGAAGFTGDGGDALNAQLYDPWDLAIDANGAIYFPDLTNNRVRRLTPNAAAIVAPLSQISISSAATLQPGPIAPSMMLYLSGSGLTNLQNIHILFQTDSQAVAAANVLAADANKITLISPAEIDGLQNVQVEVFDGATLVAQISSSAAPASPGLFADSTGQAMALNNDGTANSLANPAASGSVMVLYGTGQGIEGLPVTVSIGGNPADVLVNGPVFGSPGLWQITARVPAGYVSTGQLPVLVTVGAATSQSGVFIYTN